MELVVDVELLVVHQVHKQHIIEGGNHHVLLLQVENCEYWLTVQTILKLIDDLDLKCIVVELNDVISVSKDDGPLVSILELKLVAHVP